MAFVNHRPGVRTMHNPPEAQNLMERSHLIFEGKRNNELHPKRIVPHGGDQIVF